MEKNYVWSSYTRVESIGEELGVLVKKVGGLLQCLWSHFSGCFWGWWRTTPISWWWLALTAGHVPCVPLLCHTAPRSAISFNPRKFEQQTRPLTSNYVTFIFSLKHSPIFPAFGSLLQGVVWVHTYEHMWDREQKTSSHRHRAEGKSLFTCVPLKPSP